jgi:hypothetical protein
MPHSFAQPPIIVNIPEFVLRVYDSSLPPALIMPVVVGRALRTQTPVLEEEMKYLIFWSYWNVPPSILRGEIVPKITKDPEYLQKSNFEVATYSGEVVTCCRLAGAQLRELFFQRKRSSISRNCSTRSLIGRFSSVMVWAPSLPELTNPWRS